eukprot:tig00020904_g15246.t1
MASKGAGAVQRHRHSQQLPALGFPAHAPGGAAGAQNGADMPLSAAAAGRRSVLARGSGAAAQPAADSAPKDGKVAVYLDYDPEAARRSQSHSSSAWAVLYKRIERMTFTILFFLTDRTGKVPGLWARVLIPYAFLLYDFTQLMTLSLTQNLRVPPIRALRLLATFLVDAAFIPATQIISQPFACYLAGQTSSPGRVVHESVAAAVTTCRAFESLQVMYFSVSVVVLVTFVPFCLVFALIFYDSCPVSSTLEGRPHGRFSFLYVVVQATMIYINLFGGANVDAAHAANFALLFGLWLFLFATAPFYSTFTTAFRGGLFLAAASFPLTSKLVGLADADAGDEAGLRHWATVSLALLVPIFAAGFALTYVRVWLLTRARPAAVAKAAAPAHNRRRGSIQLQAGGRGSRPRSDDYLAPQQAGAGAEGGGAEAADLAVHLAAARRAAAAQAAAADESGGEDEPGAGAAAQGDAPAPGRSSGRGRLAALWRAARPRLIAALESTHTLFLVECQYEVRARIALRKHGDVAAAEAIYKEGMHALPQSAYIRIHYALFTRHYKGDAAAAAQRMQAAANDGVRMAFDMRYLVFEKQRLWDQIAHGQNLGQTMNSLSLLEFEQVFANATAKHGEALRLIQRFWNGVSRRQNAKYLLGASHHIGRISAASRAAADSYEALLRKHKSSKMLLRAYADFVRCVLNDPERATYLYLKADELEEAEAKALSGDHGDASEAHDGGTEGGLTSENDHDGASSHEQSTSDNARHVQNRITAKNKKSGGAEGLLNNEGQLRAVRRLQLGVLCGLAALAIIASMFYVVTRMNLEEINDGILRMNDISSQARFITAVVDHARNIYLSRYMNNTVTAAWTLSRLKNRADLFKDTQQGLYFGKPPHFGPSEYGPVRALWDEQRIEYTTYVPGTGGDKPTILKKKTGLWDLGSLFYARAVEYVSSSPAVQLEGPTNPAFRFVQDVGARALINSVLKAMTLYEEDTYAGRSRALATLGGMLAIFLCTMAVLVVCVLQPAIRRVRRTKSGAQDILGAIPRRALRKIARHYYKMKAPGSAESDDEIEDEAAAAGNGDGDGDDEAEAGGRSRKGSFGPEGPGSSPVVDLDGPEPEHGHGPKRALVPMASAAGAGAGAAPAVSAKLASSSSDYELDGKGGKGSNTASWTPGSDDARVLEPEPPGSTRLVYDLSKAPQSDAENAVRAFDNGAEDAGLKQRLPPPSSMTSAELEMAAAGAPSPAPIPMPAKWSVDPEGEEAAPDAPQPRPSQAPILRRRSLMATSHAHSSSPEPEGAGRASNWHPRVSVQYASGAGGKGGDDESDGSETGAARAAKVAPAPAPAHAYAAVTSATLAEILGMHARPTAGSGADADAAPAPRAAPAATAAEETEKEKEEEEGEGESAAAVVQTGSIFRRMVLRYLTAFAVLASLGCVGYGLCAWLINTSSEVRPRQPARRAHQRAVSVIRYAGYRRHHTRYIVYLARDMYLNNGVAGFTKAEAVNLVLESMQALELAHAGLRYGNATDNVKSTYSNLQAQRDLLYGTPCLRGDGDCSAAKLGYLAPLVSQGLQFLYQQWMGLLERILKENKVYTEDGELNRAAPFFSDPSPKPLPKSEMAQGNRGYYSGNYIEPKSEAMKARPATLFDVQVDYLETGLAMSQVLYEEAASADLARADKVAAAVLAVQLAAIALVFGLVFRPIIRQLREECGRSDELLRMLPKEMLPLLKELQRFFRSANAEAADEAGRGLLSEAAASLGDIAGFCCGPRDRRARPGPARERSASIAPAAPSAPLAASTSTSLPRASPV